MQSRVALVIPFLVLPSFVLATRQEPATLALTNVAVIDATGAPLQANKTVIIAGDRIAAINDGNAPIPNGARVIRSQGKFLIPGLWDMHVHLTAGDLPRLVASGVTGVRDMGNALQDVDAWRAKIDVGAIVGPLVYRVGPILNGEEFGPAQFAVTTDAEARSAVRLLKKLGVDQVKLHKTVSREVFLALVDEAKKQSLPLVGHVAQSVSAAEASNAGQASLEHVQTLFEAQSPPKPDSEPSLFVLFARNGTAFDPTLVAYRGSTEPQNVDPELVRRYPDLIAGRKQLFVRFVKLVGMMNQAGVTLLTGTDLSTNFKWISPGASLHEELGLFVEAGLTPMQALQAATRNPARFLHVDGGTIEVGKRADLVLLEANPLADIRNTQRISAVILAGKFLDQSRLNALRESK